MLRKTFTRALLLFHFAMLASTMSRSQCTTTLNWDNLDYLTTAGTYSGFVTSAMSLTQNFAFGTNRLTVAVSNAGTNWTLSGENTSHTGEGSSYGAGADVQFATTTATARTITLTFDAEVSTFKLSLYDIDASQRVTVTAADALGTAKTITLSKPGTGTVTLASNPGTSPTGTGNASSYANNVTTGTLNIDIAGPVKTVILSFSNAVGDFWMSDIAASVSTCLPNSYWNVAKPFTGQSAYVLVVVDNNIYYTNITTGVSTLLFTDAGWTNLNALGYDPVNGFVYYCYTLTGSPGTDKAIKKYDVSTGAISTVLADVTTLGIPVFENGVEVGAGAFYNGSYYLGIEAYNSGVATARKSTIWRIDFNASNVPYRACQVYGIPVDAGTTITHDWGDFAISNGILYDFDAAAADYDYYHYNMTTGALTNYTPSGGANPSQTAIAWNEQLYNINGNIMTYSNGVVGSQTAISGTTGVRWGDAGESYRPFVDFGDAPITYDPSGSDPAVHQASQSTLRIGANINIEAAKRGTTSTEDFYDDGISTVSFLLPGVSNYLVSVNVFNNTGSNATLTAWLDYNGDGVFSASEGITQTVATSGGVQSKYLYWPGINTTMANGSITYLRVRITSAANGMTVSTPTGFFNNGEVEDYKVNVDNYPLASTLFSFDAKEVNSNSVKIDWSVNEQGNGIVYEIQKSRNSSDWIHLASLNGGNLAGLNSYTYSDKQPYKGTSYYRLNWQDGTGRTQFSSTRQVSITDLADLISIAPNPVIDRATINIFNTSGPCTATIKIIGMQGNELVSRDILLRSGANQADLPVDDNWVKGIYTVQVAVNGRIVTKKLVVRR